MFLEESLGFHFKSLYSCLVTCELMCSPGVLLFWKLSFTNILQKHKRNSCVCTVEVIANLEPTSVRVAVPVILGGRKSRYLVVTVPQSAESRPWGPTVGIQRTTEKVFGYSSIVNHPNFLVTVIWFPTPKVQAGGLRWHDVFGWCMSNEHNAFCGRLIASGLVQWGIHVFT